MSQQEEDHAELFNQEPKEFVPSNTKDEVTQQQGNKSNKSIPSSSKQLATKPKRHAKPAIEYHTQQMNSLLFYHPKAREEIDQQRKQEALQNFKSDEQLLKESYRFIRSAEDDEKSKATSTIFEQDLSRKYYDKLYKEYALVDLSRYKEHAIGMRWRIEREVVAGKGQSICGEVSCKEMKNLETFEVPFAYKEQGESKSALVKVSLCPRCAKHMKKAQKKDKKKKEKKRKHDDDSDNEDKLEKAKQEIARLEEKLASKRQKKKWIDLLLSQHWQGIGKLFLDGISNGFFRNGWQFWSFQRVWQFNIHIVLFVIFGNIETP